MEINDIRKGKKSLGPDDWVCMWDVVENETKMETQL